MKVHGYLAYHDGKENAPEVYWWFDAATAQKVAEIEKEWNPDVFVKEFSIDIEDVVTDFIWEVLV